MHATPASDTTNTPQTRATAAGPACVRASNLLLSVLILESGYHYHTHRPHKHTRLPCLGPIVVPDQEKQTEITHMNVNRNVPLAD